MSRKIQDPVKLAAARERMAKARAARDAKKLSGATGDAVESGGLVLPCSTSVAPENNSGPVTLTVKSKPQNPRMLIATGDGQDRHVEVGNSENFIVGMKLQAIPHPREPAFYRLVGQPPRFRGRW